MATSSREEDSHTCALCLGIFCQPKFLSCHHTFCSPCIQRLADQRPGRPFRCPTCRRETSMPAGGVAALQTNFYLPSTSSERKRPAPQDLCQVHPDEKLRFYCAQCDQAICRDCKLTRHEQHPTDDIASAASSKRKQLKNDQQRLQGAVSTVVKTVESLKQEKESLQKKREAVEKQIHNRHAILMAAADRKRDEELRSLQSLHAQMDRDVDSSIQQKEDSNVELLHLLQQLNDIITSGTDSDVISVFKEMRSGRGRQQKVDALTSREDRPLQRPVLHFKVTDEVMTQTAHDYLGSVERMEMKETRPDMRVTERFQCAQDPDTEVFSISHLDSNPPNVYVSYEWCGGKKDAPWKAFSETGNCVFTGTNNKVGKVSSKRFAKGQCMFTIQQSGRLRTYCKNPTAAHFSQANNMTGRADIERSTVTSTGPLKTKTKTEFSIKVGPHRAFDVDETETHFAVVEEAKDSTHRRSIRLYRQSLKKAVTTYTPPTADFQPSDVCFYSLRGQNVLLITDEINDAIHVVTIHGNRMQFERFLCAGSPSIVQPTAITVDLQGRLWVACKGGAVLTMEQIE